MKKIALLGLGLCLVAFVTLTSFDQKSDYEAQMEEIDNLVQEELDAYRLEKELECKERALVEAMPLAEEQIAALGKKGSTKKPVTASKPSKPTSTGTTTTTTTTTTYTPPPTNTTPTPGKKGTGTATGAPGKKGAGTINTNSGGTNTPGKKPGKRGGN